MRLIAIALVGFALRLAYLLQVASQPGFRWHDPDFYLRGGRLLAKGPHGWHWTFDAVTLWICAAAAMRAAALSGLPVTSSRRSPICRSLRSSRSCVLSVASIVLIVELGRRLHSRRDGPDRGGWLRASGR